MTVTTYTARIAILYIQYTLRLYPEYAFLSHFNLKTYAQISKDKLYIHRLEFTKVESGNNYNLAYKPKKNKSSTLIRVFTKENIYIRSCQHNIQLSSSLAQPISLGSRLIISQESLSTTSDMPEKCRSNMSEL